MFNQNKNLYLILGVILISFLVLGFGMFWAINAFSFKVGTVDLDKVAKSSELSKEMNQDLQLKGQELQGKMKLAKTDTEKNRIRAEFESYQTGKQAEFVEKLKKVVPMAAKRRGVKAVSSPQVFIYSGIDLTDDLIKEMDRSYKKGG